MRRFDEVFAEEAQRHDENGLFAECVLLVGDPVRDADLAAQLRGHCGSNLHFAASVQAAARLLGGGKFRLVLFDLDYAQSGVLELVEELCEGAGTPEIALVGFSIEDRAETRAIWVATGITELLTRSGMVEGMGTMLNRYLSSAVSFDGEELIKRMLGNESLAKRVIHVFLEDAPHQLLVLEDAIRSHDIARSSRIAHSIRGSAANAGCSSLVGLTQEIESAGSKGDIVSAQRLIAELKRNFGRLAPKMQEFCD